METNLWDDVIGRIEAKVNRHSFYTWFKPTSFVADQGSVMVGQGARSGLPGLADPPLRRHHQRSPRGTAAPGRPDHLHRRTPPKSGWRRLSSGEALPPLGDDESARRTGEDPPEPAYAGVAYDGSPAVGPEPPLHLRERSSSGRRISLPKPPAGRWPRCRRVPTTRSTSTAGSGSARRTSCTRSVTTR